MKVKLNQLKIGVVLSYLTQAVHILSGLVYTPVMLRLLGQSEYGLYNLVSSVVAYLSMLNFGFGASYMRFYSRYKIKEDEKGIAKLNGMFLIVFLIISVVCLFAGTFLVFKADIVFGKGLSQYELKKAKILMSIMIINLVFSLLGTVFGNYITAHERFVFQKSINLITTLLSPFITLPLLILGYGSVAMVCVSFLLTLLGMLLNVYYCFCKLNMKMTFKNFDFPLFKEMWVFTSFIFINIITDQIEWSVDKFLLGRMLGTIAVAVYSVASNINNMYKTFATNISSVFVPKVNMMVSAKDDIALNKLFIKVGRIQMIIIGLIASGYVVFGKEFISMWAGAEYMEAYYVGLFLMLPLTIPLIQNLGIEVQRAKNKHYVSSIVYLVIALINILISVVFIGMWGAVGAAAGTAISLIMGEGIFMNIYYQKKLGLNIIKFWKEICKVVFPILITMSMAFIFKNFVSFDRIITFGIGIVLYCLIYLILMFLIGANESEKSLLLFPINKLKNKLINNKKGFERD